MECGLVLEEPLLARQRSGPGTVLERWQRWGDNDGGGGGEEAAPSPPRPPRVHQGGPRRARRTRRRHRWRCAADSAETEAESEAEGREWVAHLLSKFYMDGDQLVDKVWARFHAVYEGRRRRGEVRGSGNRRRVALAYALLTVLNEEGVPRPFAHIADLCEVPRSHRRRVLHAGRTLALGEGAAAVTDASDTPATDYVNNLCAQLGIPFSVGQQAERVLDDDAVKWGLYGHRPHHLAAAAVEKVLLARKLESRERCLARVLGCGASPIRRLVAKIPNELCYR